MTNRLAAYQLAINQIDDYFEYRHESERDKAVVRGFLAELTEALSGQVQDGDGCKKCGAELVAGKAMAQTFTPGMPDFPGHSDSVVTMSAGGPGKLVDCMKCVECGWSVTE